MELDDQVEFKKQSCNFFAITRYLILALSLLCISCSNANFILMNFTVICMDDMISDSSYINQTHWLQNSYGVSMTFSSAAIGAISGTIPVVTFITRFGIRKVVFFYGIISAVGTLLMPLAVTHGFATVVLARFLQGIGASILYSSIGKISEQWSTTSEIGLYVAILSSAFQISNVVTMPTAGIMCDSFLGWRSTYYMFGAITIASYSTFYIYYRDFPSNHRHVGIYELKKIQEGKGDAVHVRKVHFLSIFKNFEIMELTIAIVGGSIAVICLNNYGPIYLNKVLGLNVKETGYSNAIPYGIALFAKLAAGSLTDRMSCVSVRTRLILFTLIPQTMMAAGFLTMAFTTNVFIAQLAYTLSVVLAGLNVIGIVKSAKITCTHQLDLIMSVVSFSSWSSAFFLPILIGVFCPNNTHAEWSRFYIGVAVLVVLTNIPFPILSRLQTAVERE